MAFPSGNGELAKIVAAMRPRKLLAQLGLRSRVPMNAGAFPFLFWFLLDGGGMRFLKLLLFDLGAHHRTRFQVLLFFNQLLPESAAWGGDVLASVTRTGICSMNDNASFLSSVCAIQAEPLGYCLHPPRRLRTDLPHRIERLGILSAGAGPKRFGVASTGARLVFPKTCISSPLFTVQGKAGVLATKVDSPASGRGPVLQ